MTGNGQYEYTKYSCCCNTDTQVYYYTTYQDPAIRSVSMHEAELDGDGVYYTPIGD